MRVKMYSVKQQQSLTLARRGVCLVFLICTLWLLLFSVCRQTALPHHSHCVSLIAFGVR